MDTNVIVMFQLFTKEQKILIYQKGECIKTLHPYLENVVETLNELKLKYNIKNINLCGSKSFTSKYANKLKTKFAKDVDISLIER